MDADTMRRLYWFSTFVTLAVVMLGLVITRHGGFAAGVMVFGFLPHLWLVLK